jgi:hypothetical protein
MQQVDEGGKTLNNQDASKEEGRAISAMNEDREISLPPMLRPVWKGEVHWFSREQMADYARLAVLADREQR